MAYRRFSRISRLISSYTCPSIKSSTSQYSTVASPLHIQKITILSSSPNYAKFSNGRLRLLSTQAMVDVPRGGVVDVPLAQPGEGIAECELLKWFVQEGDLVDEFERLCEVQSDKATIEITSRFKGKIVQLHFLPGDIVKVGETLLRINVDDAQESLTVDGEFNNVSEMPNVCELESVPESITEIMENIKTAEAKVLSTPSVRHLAKEHGININDICGTGKENRVLKEDVLRHVASKSIHIEDSHTSSCEQQHMLISDKYLDTVNQEDYPDKIVQLRGFQRAMVKSMTIAAKVPHFHYLEEINCDALLNLKTAFQNANTDPDIKHTFLPFLIKSLSMALNKYPLLNSSFNEENNEIILKGCHNIGVAMATSFGLVVPNVKKVQSLSILEITKELSRLYKLASNNKLSTEDISGGTITLSNIGTIGGKFGCPVLNLPEAAIIAIGRMQQLPRFADDGSVYPATVTNVTIGADHRIVDGATVAKFCNEWKLLIEKPDLLLLHMR